MSSAEPSQRSVAAALIGRHRELGVIDAFLAESAVNGAALLLSGEPGVGKTVLLDAAEEAAATAGHRVLRAAGVQFEADVSFAGVNQALLPLVGDLERLSATHREALSVALGFGDGPPPDRLVVSNAALMLLRQAASTRPLLVIVDDLQWLDRSSAGVLGFVARRLSASHVGLLVASRSGTETFFARGGIPEYEVPPLDDEAAASLVGLRFPTLAPRVRQRLLAEAQGNPLALLELPSALSSSQLAAERALPAVLPLSRRLQAVFASRIGGLPTVTRELLLLAGLDSTGDPHVLQVAISNPKGLDDLAPAERARLVLVDNSTRRLTFHHPLIRSAVVELSTSSERRRAHTALAEQLADQPERRAWHLAEASVEPDEEVAGLLENVGYRNLRRGDAVGAVAALLRAADLSPGRSDRGRRLAQAAYVGADVTGDLRDVARLLEEAHQADPELSASLEAAIAAAVLLLNSQGDVDTAHRLLAGAIDMRTERLDANDTAVVEALYTLLLVCFFGGRVELWQSFYAALARVRPHIPEVLAVCSQTFPDPVRTAAPALDRLAIAIRGLRDVVDPTQIVRVAIAADYVDRLAGCREALQRVIDDGRSGGAVGSQINALILLGVDEYLTGQWDAADELLAEAIGLCETRGYRLLAWPGVMLQALLAAARGDYATTWRLTDEMSRWAEPRGIQAVRWYAGDARALAALGQGDFEYAYQQAATVSPPGVFTPYNGQALWTMLNLVEAAMHTNRQAEAAAHVAAMRAAGIAGLSPRLALLVSGSAAIAASDGAAAELFEAALAIPGVDRWPFDLARVQLAYGMRLRRGRATLEARTHLRAAVETFQRLGARPWITRANNELRATGQRRTRAEDLAPGALTPQEREIAMLAAAGMSNKRIAEILFVSPRTVGGHLYRVFPKLGVTSRAGLRDALAARPHESFD